MLSCNKSWFNKTYYRRLSCNQQISCYLQEITWKVGMKDERGWMALFLLMCNFWMIMIRFDVHSYLSFILEWRYQLQFVLPEWSRYAVLQLPTFTQLHWRWVNMLPSQKDCVSKNEPVGPIVSHHYHHPFQLWSTSFLICLAQVTYMGDRLGVF